MPIIVHAFMALLFLFSAMLQLNDPDPLPWVAIYLGASALAVLAASRRWSNWRRAVAFGLVVITLVWAVAVAFGSPTLPPLLSLFGDWEMHGAGIEERRETLGLLIIGLYAAWVARPPRAGAASRPG